MIFCFLFFFFFLYFLITFVFALVILYIIMLSKVRFTLPIRSTRWSRLSKFPRPSSTKFLIGPVYDFYPDRHPTVHDLNSTIHDSLKTPSRIHPDNKMNTYSIIPIKSRSLHDLYTIFTRIARPNQLFTISAWSRPDQIDLIVGIFGNWSDMHIFSIKTSDFFLFPAASKWALSVTLVHPYARTSQDDVIYASWGIISVPWTRSPFIWLYSVDGPSKIIHLKYLHRNKAIEFVDKVHLC